MQRVTITLDDALLAAIDERVSSHGYQGRSEAVRDLLRTGLLQTHSDDDPDGACVATLSYVYDHGTRELSKRLNGAFHDHHDLTLSTLHVHLDQGKCMEVSVLKGSVSEVSQLARQVMAERGVRHGSAQIIPLPAGEDL
ncbi:nickel-responsive transcriptional regulator NikR [Pseudomonas helleri]|uniref:Putative nickel-responsive regulator n=1 Tax=Pseudomonas helleri TaxID=1608996 RepID=A0A6A7Z0M4_9PSED|nr:nickel-responsive transcriptional regulator NikR [Pseudomonas helleri]MQT27897.1 nickel-responsive transcriptional regulator NikR [Pseudomonas helleri]MQT81375.1 nickel-responsive transcriptional regulator NikR [Pseudomonas helleri]MQU17818.1 nickel-responsive transcriptional regulator NikR [Pseudomonas helleri]MQU28426.1 nickel-responsive transcriptional regulator NikR [Pseudomonas helleri]